MFQPRRLRTCSPFVETTALNPSYLISEAHPGRRGSTQDEAASVEEGAEPSLDRGQGVPDELVERLIEVPGG